MRHKIYSSLLIIALTVSAFAQTAQQARSDIDAKRLQEHVEYLASDELEGRRTGTEAAMMAAYYIAREFESLGFDCPEPDRWMCHHTSNNFYGYVKAFPFVAAVQLGKNNSMLFTPRVEALAKEGRAASLDLRVGDDWMPLSFSANGKVENAPVVFVGYGITSAKLKHDDYAGVDAKGKIALAFAGTPDGDNPHGQFARYNDARFKAAAARDHGALALVLVARTENFKDERLAHLSNDYTSSDAGLPVVVLSRQVAERALTAGGLTALADVEKIAQTKSVSAALPHVAFSITTDIARKSVSAANVVGILEGSDPKLKTEVILIGAHYDHLGRGGQGSLAPREGEIHHGADDNASGVAGLLELARVLATSPQKPRRTIVFVAFAGEEEGLLGSSYYVEHPAFPLAQTVAMLNMDMIGRLREGKLNIGGVGTAKEWRKIVGMKNSDVTLHSNNAKENLNELLKQPGAMTLTDDKEKLIGVFTQSVRFNLALNEDGYGPSDHSSFYAKGIPVLFFFTGTHDDYHKPTDTADKINYAGEAEVVTMVLNIVREIDSRGARPTYTVAKSDNPNGRTTGFNVYLGTIPNYGESSDGLLLDGVRDDSPAARAGLKAGDKVVRLAGREIKNVYDYTYALGEMKAGQEYEIEVMRGGARLKMKIVPAARK